MVLMVSRMKPVVCPMFTHFSLVVSVCIGRLGLILTINLLPIIKFGKL
jgi:hypothetical protein